MGNDLQARDVNWQVAALGAIEYRIRQRKENIAHEFYGLGDDLNEAKERGIVPHGEWEGWATEVTGLAIRTVQRLMQAAREVPPEKRQASSLGQLEFRQLSAVLTLPEGEREGMADKAVADGMTSREVEEAVRKAREEASAAISEAERKKDLAEQSRSKAIKEMQAAQIEARNVKANAQEADNTRVDQYRALMATAEKNDQINQKTIEALNAQLAAAKGKPAGIATNDTEQEAEIQRLQRELNTAQAYARDQARLRAAAQDELLRAQSQAARDAVTTDQPVGLTLAQFADAARAFVGRCGALPHMRTQLMGVTKREREEWESAMAMVQTLLDGGREALNLIDGGGYSA